MALEFNSDLVSNFEGALVVEMVGVHKWSYQSKYKKIGASIIASYNESDEKVGYGVLLRLPQNWALGVVDRDGNTSIALTVDLGKLLTDNKTSKAAFNKIIH